MDQCLSIPHTCFFYRNHSTTTGISSSELFAFESSSKYITNSIAFKRNSTYAIRMSAFHCLMCGLRMKKICMHEILGIDSMSGSMERLTQSKKAGVN